MAEIQITPGKLLVVDDNEMNRLLLAKGLELQEHQVVTANDGQQALDLLRREAFDLVLLDIYMPVMDGFEVLEKMIADPSLRQIPVIMISASEELDSVVRCIERGAEDYLIKPPNPVLLRAQVNASLEKKRLRDQQRKLFRTFTTYEIADELLNQGFTLGGKRVHATAMFCDVRNFTSIAESQDPEETISLLNALYALIFESIISHGGSINQIQGDGVMGIFGAPAKLENHAGQAVLSAIELTKHLKQFNAEHAGTGTPHITIGIGIATGKMVAGYAGTRDRATYTCIGDTVNLAARLEAHTKVAKKPILIDEFTQMDLPPGFNTTLLGPEVFKGKSMSVNVFAVE